MKHYARLSGIVFGVLMLLLALAVTAETLLRKFFSVSLGGMDELGGYAMAVCAPLAFTVALIERAHIRINLFQVRMSPRAQALTNALSAVSLGMLSAYLFYFTWTTLLETRSYHSTAQTPWATPLVYPQSVWLAAMGVFAVAAIILGGQALRLALRADWAALNSHFGADTLTEELETELSDLAKREVKLS
ncbi:TRAP dicarboxylate transporter subunit DctQ [Pseudomonas sp. Ag1]|uniref:TRAP transporter small permease subunit n=1 Tax=Pseudomonas sp. Ag1 TaxID=1197727 RepID=UPI000272C8AD|nr:TRAP transporter small permease [Pseudomonas sp. Ag1]EJF69763.1 TRAP dicarboxylate transporter subunit DctQ [Pseudomonas sp. Ag1]